jgi:phosphoesterase RecJ-like protein
LTKEQLIALIRKTTHFILTGHETPDADAIGAEMALARALRALGKTVYVVNCDPTPALLEFLDPHHEIVVLTGPTDLDVELESYGLLMLDVADPENVGSVKDWVMPRVAFTHAIDHHEPGKEEPEYNYNRSEASSTCEILYDLISALAVPIDIEIALPMYTGIVYDTGSFVYPKTSKKTFEIAEALVAVGLKPYDIYTQLYESNTVASLVLQARVLATLEFHFGHAVAVQTMTRRMLAETGAAYDEGQRLINVPLAASSVRVSVFFKENPEGLIRCSLRSKGRVDVAEIARRFHGGGHRTAAGFKLSRPLDETAREVLLVLQPLFAKAQTTTG